MKQFCNCTRLSMLFFVMISIQYVANAQNDSISGTELINYYISNNQFKQADSTLNAQIHNFKKLNQIDSLYKFPLFIGKVALLNANATHAADRAQYFVNNLSRLTTNKRTMFKAYLSMDDLYYHLGDDKNCLKVSKKALEYAQSVKDIKQKELGEVNYAIGSNYYALYDLSNALIYFKKSAEAYEKAKNVKKDMLSDAYNGVAVGMWTLNKLDSAQVYYNKAIKAAKESDLKGFDKLYYISAFKFNLALVLDDSGNVGEAIEIKKEIIKNFQNIIDNSKDEELIQKSERLSSSAFSNLAALYNDIGFFTKALNMLKYSYEKKKIVYEPTNPRLVTTIMQIATAEIELMNLDKGIETINKGLN